MVSAPGPVNGTAWNGSVATVLKIISSRPAKELVGKLTTELYHEDYQGIFIEIYGILMIYDILGPNLDATEVPISDTIEVSKARVRTFEARMLEIPLRSSATTHQYSNTFDKTTTNNNTMTHFEFLLIIFYKTYVDIYISTIIDRGVYMASEKLLSSERRRSHLSLH